MSTSSVSCRRCGESWHATDVRWLDPCLNGGSHDPVLSTSKPMSGHQRPVRGATDVWLTPPEMIEALGPFDLDPCAAVGQPWPTAAKHYTVEDDGLSHEWEGFVWCNPPFGPDAEKWLMRLAKHGNGIGLCPARTETRWFVNTVWNEARAILFLHGRPYFHRPDGVRGHANSGAPICLVAYGLLGYERLSHGGLTGTLVAGWNEIGPQVSSRDGRSYGHSSAATSGGGGNPDAPFPARIHPQNG